MIFLCWSNMLPAGLHVWI